jgi:hypothetical protein
MAEKFKCSCMEARPAYTLDLAEKTEFNINSTYICMCVCMYVRPHACVCLCKLEYLSRYVVSVLFVCFFVCLHVRTYITLVTLHSLCGVMSKNHY